MYISIVQIDLPDNVDLDDLTEGFLISGPRYRHISGLLRKYYTMKDEVITGGVFVWESRKYALAGHSDSDWNDLIWNKYGVKPEITYHEVPVVVDNVIGGVYRGSDYLEAVL